MNKFRLAESMSTMGHCLAEQVIRVSQNVIQPRSYNTQKKLHVPSFFVCCPVDVPSLITCRPPSHHHNQISLARCAVVAAVVYLHISWTQIFAHFEDWPPKWRDSNPAAIPVTPIGLSGRWLDDELIRKSNRYPEGAQNVGKQVSSSDRRGIFNDLRNRLLLGSLLPGINLLAMLIDFVFFCLCNWGMQIFRWNSKKESSADLFTQVGMMFETSNQSNEPTEQ